MRWPVYLLAAVCWAIGLVQSGAYDPERVLRWYREVTHVLWGAAIGSTLMAGLLFLSFREMSRLQFLYFVTLSVLLILAARALFRVYYRLLGRRRPGVRSRVLVLGAGDLGRRVARVLLDHSRWGFNPLGYLDDDPAKQGETYEGLPVLGTLDRVAEVVKARRVEEVWVALPARAVDRLNWVVSALETVPVRIKVVPDYFSLALVQAKPEIFGGIPIIGLRDPVIEGLPRMVKRAFDLLVAIILLIAFAPLMGLIALLIRLDSPGPIIFRQKRVGENGRLFDMLKFRTMVPEAERLQAQVLQTTEEGEVIHKRPDDPRVTRIGRFLRRYSLDELPQLLNVIRGEMSLVGPRPEVPWLALAGARPLVTMSWGSDLLVGAARAPGNWVARFTLARSTILACDCQAVRRAAHALGMRDDRIVEFPWGVDLEHFKPGEPSCLRSQLGWDEAFILLSTRAWERLLGVDVLVEGFVRAAAQEPRLRLVMLGDGPLRPWVEQRLKRAGMEDRVHRPGRVEHQSLPGYYRAADLYVSASHSDGSSVSLMEALACGRPALVSDIPGNREWVVPGVNGWWFRDGDPEDLAARLRLAVEAADLADMGRRARRVAEARADWRRNFPRLLEAYHLARALEDGR